jgi:hypothetical protein
MGPDNAIRTDFHAFVDDGISPDLNGTINLRLWMDNGGGMDHE